MTAYDKNDLLPYGIEYSAAIPFSACRIINERKAKFLYSKMSPCSAIVFLVPYYAGSEEKNISKYAISEDYHVFMRSLFEKLCQQLYNKYGGSFIGMADSSPTDEVSAAVYAGPCRRRRPDGVLGPGDRFDADAAFIRFAQQTRGFDRKNVSAVFGSQCAQPRYRPFRRALRDNRHVGRLRKEVRSVVAGQGQIA